MPRHKIKCFRCGGSGTTREVDPFLAVFTLGITALIDLAGEECDACDGEGWIWSE